MKKNPEHFPVQRMLLTVLASQEEIAKILSTLAIKMGAGHAALEAQSLQRNLADARKAYREEIT